jgi:peptide deformylase
MSILKIARMGHPVLSGIAAPVRDPTAPEIKRLVADMIETMEDANGAGLASPQIHVPCAWSCFRPPRRASDSNLDDPETFDQTAPLTVWSIRSSKSLIP